MSWETDDNGRCTHPARYVVTDPPEPEVGFSGARYCDLCGQDMTPEDMQ